MCNQFERNDLMNRFTRWKIFSPLLLLVLLLPILAACGGSPQAAAPAAAPAATAPVSATAAPMVMANPTTMAVPATNPVGLNKLNHIVVIVQENWSFDSLYSEFPGAK